MSEEGREGGPYCSPPQNFGPALTACPPRFLTPTLEFAPPDFFRPCYMPVIITFMKLSEKIHGMVPYGIYKGAGAKCDHQRIGVRTRVRANLDLDVRGACVRRQKRSQLTP